MTNFGGVDVVPLLGAIAGCQRGGWRPTIDILFCMFCGSRLLFLGPPKWQHRTKVSDNNVHLSSPARLYEHNFPNLGLYNEPQGFPRSKDWMHFCNSISSGCAACSSVCFFWLKEFQERDQKRQKNINLETYPVPNSALRFLWGQHGQPSEVRAFSFLLNLTWSFNPLGRLQSWVLSGVMVDGLVDRGHRKSGCNLLAQGAPCFCWWCMVECTSIGHTSLETCVQVWTCLQLLCSTGVLDKQNQELVVEKHFICIDSAWLTLCAHNSNMFEDKRSFLTKKLPNLLFQFGGSNGAYIRSRWGSCFWRDSKAQSLVSALNWLDSRHFA